MPLSSENGKRRNKTRRSFLLSDKQLFDFTNYNIFVKLCQALWRDLRWAFPTNRTYGSAIKTPHTRRGAKNAENPESKKRTVISKCQFCGTRCPSRVLTKFCMFVESDIYISHRTQHGLKRTTTAKSRSQPAEAYQARWLNRTTPGALSAAIREFRQRFILRNWVCFTAYFFFAFFGSFV